MKGFRTLLILCYSLTATLVMTASPSLTTPIGGGFNATLRATDGGGGKSTPRVANGLATIVIDAGHGGRDPGGMGRRSLEKDIALSVARIVTLGIRAQHPEINVLTTRDDDTFVPLEERAQFANDAGADLFLSIHANMAPNRKAYGTETWVMSERSAAENLAVVRRENGVIKLENDYSDRYDWSPGNREASKIAHRAQTEYLDRSLTFARLVERHFTAAGRHSRGVKRGGFVVLRKTAMPSVLIELGFMSNRTEEGYLLSKHGQLVLAGAILDAFGDYYAHVGGSDQPVAATPQPEPDPVAINVTALKKELIATPQGTPAVAATSDADGGYYPASFGVAPMPVAAKPAPTTPVAPQSIAIALPVEEGPVIGLQLAATKAPVDTRRQGWDQIGYPVGEYRDQDYYRYQVRGFASRADALEAQNALKEQGLASMIVVYRGERRLLGNEMASILAK